MSESKEADFVTKMLADMDEVNAENPCPVEKPQPVVPALVPKVSSTTSATLDALWPGNIPSVPEALSAIREEIVLPEYETITRALCSALPDSVRVSLQATGEDSTATLRKAIVCCWRLEVAKLCVPTKGPIDNELTEKMLAEVDEILTALQAPEDSPPELEKDICWLRGILTRSAVDFSEILQKIAKEQARAAAEASAQKFQPTKTRVLSFKKETSLPTRRTTRTWIIALVLVSLAAISFHVWRYYEKQARRAALASPIPGTIRMSDPQATVQVFSAAGNQSLDPAAVSRFKATAEKQGKTIREIAPGELMVMPISMAEKIDQIQSQSTEARKQP